MSESKGKFHGYKVVFACFCILVVHSGGAGILSIYMKTLMDDLGITSSQIGVVVALGTVTAFFVTLFTGIVIEKIGPKWTLATASVFMVTQALLMTQAKGISTIIICALFSGIAGGLGTHVAVSSCIAEWFIDKRSAMTSLAFGGPGIGAAVFKFIAGFMVTSMDWRTSYYIWAVVFAVLSLGMNLLFIRTPEQKNQKPYGWEKEQEILGEAQTSTKELPGLTFKKATKTITFKAWWLGFLMIAMLFTTFGSFAPVYWQQSGMAVEKAATFSSLISLGAAVSIMLGGTMIDKYGPRFFVIYTSAAIIIAGILMALFPNKAFIITLVTVLLVALSAPTDCVYPSSITGHAFGMRDYTKIQAQLMGASYLGRAIQPLIVGKLADATGSYQVAFFEVAIVGVIGMLIVLFGLRKAPFDYKKQVIIGEEQVATEDKQEAISE